MILFYFYLCAETSDVGLKVDGGINISGLINNRSIYCIWILIDLDMHTNMDRVFEDIDCFLS